MSEQLCADISQDTTAELCDLASNSEISRHGDLRTFASRLELSSDDRAGVTLTTGVAAGSIKDRFVIHVISFDERGLALVLRLDRPNLDLDDSAVFVAFDFLELCAGQTWSNALNIGQHLPRRVNRHAHFEGVDQFHRSRSSTVSTSDASPWQATAATRSGLLRNSTRAPSSPSCGSSAQISAFSRTGFPRTPS